MTTTGTLAEAPTRRISVTTVDGLSFELNEYHQYSSLTITHPDGTVDETDTVNVEHIDLRPGNRFAWEELVFDGSSRWHEAGCIASVFVSYPR